MRICSFSAHPGDSIVYAGGTLGKYAEKGHEVFDICVSDGRLLTQDYPEEEVKEKRAEERKAAGRILNFKEVRDLGYRDLELSYSEDIVSKITNIILELRPEIVLTNWWQSVHPDLSNLAKAVSDALIRALFVPKSNLPPYQVKKLYTYGTLDSLNFEPQIYIDITELATKKKEAISEFKLIDKVIREWEGKRSRGYADLVVSQDRSNGLYSSVTYAEAFREFLCVETKSRAISLLPI